MPQQKLDVVQIATREMTQSGACPPQVVRRQLVAAFLAASRGGDFGALLAVLDPDIVLRADDAAVQMGASAGVRGAAAVAETFSKHAQAAQPAVVNGAAGLVWAPGGRPRVVISFTFGGEKIVAMELVADPERLGQLDLVSDE